MSDKCECSLRTRCVGDGCRHCNPQHYIDILIMQAKDDAETIDTLESKIKKTEQERDAYGASRLPNWQAMHPYGLMD